MEQEDYSSSTDQGLQDLLHTHQQNIDLLRTQQAEAGTLSGRVDLVHQVAAEQSAIDALRAELRRRSLPVSPADTRSGATLLPDHDDGHPEHLRRPLVVALGVLAALATIIALVIALPSFKADSSTTYRGRVLNAQTGSGIASAKVMLDIGGQNPRTAYTDGEGVYSVVFTLSSDTEEGKIRVEMAGFAPYDRNITITRQQPQLEEIRLTSLAAAQPAAAPTATPAESAAAPPNNGGLMPGVLPESAPLLTTTILLAGLPQCGEVFSDLAGRLRAEFGERDPPILVVEAPAAAGSPAARQLGAANGADLVVWAICLNGAPAVSAEILSQRGAPEAYEPPQLAFQPASQPQLIDVIHALGLYLSRDYFLAADEFVSLAPAFATDLRMQATLYLLEGNSFLFFNEDNYEDAVAAFQQAQRLNEPQIGPLAKHNLGFVKANIGWIQTDIEEAIGIFSETLTYNPNFALASINRGKMWLWAGIILQDEAFFDSAQQDCRRAREQTRQSPNGSLEDLWNKMAVTCLIRTQFLRSICICDSHNTEAPLVGELDGLETQFWSEPAYIRIMINSQARYDTAILNQSCASYYHMIEDDVMVFIAKQDHEMAGISC